MFDINSKISGIIFETYCTGFLIHFPCPVKRQWNYVDISHKGGPDDSNKWTLRTESLQTRNLLMTMDNDNTARSSVLTGIEDGLSTTTSSSVRDTILICSLVTGGSCLEQRKHKIKLQYSYISTILHVKKTNNF